jgi:hypothetical protein
MRVIEQQRINSVILETDRFAVESGETGVS